MQHPDVPFGSQNRYPPSHFLGAAGTFASAPLNLADQPWLWFGVWGRATAMIGMVGKPVVTSGHCSELEKLWGSCPHPSWTPVSFLALAHWQYSYR